MKRIDNKWFYSTPPLWANLFTVFVKGDMIAVVPFLIAVAFVGLWSIRFMVLVYAVYFTMRSIGEMHYWFHQQHFDMKYRPFDFGLKKLDNKAIYIIYQVWAMNFAVIGISTILYVLYFWSF